MLLWVVPLHYEVWFVMLLWAVPLHYEVWFGLLLWVVPSTTEFTIFHYADRTLA